MSIQKSVFDGVKTLVNALNNYASVLVGSLPADNGICMAASTGSVLQTTLAHGGQYSMDIVLNAKHESQSMCMDTLQTIHEALNKTKTYPTGTDWAVTAIRTNGAPGYLGRDEAQWLYGSGLTVEYTID